MRFRWPPRLGLAFPRSVPAPHSDVRGRKRPSATVAYRTSSKSRPRSGTARKRASSAPASWLLLLGDIMRQKFLATPVVLALEKYEYVPCWFLAMAWVGLDEGGRALDALEQAFRDHEPRMVSLKVDAIFDPLREEPRFKEMVRGVGLEP